MEKQLGNQKEPHRLLPWPKVLGRLLGNLLGECFIWCSLQLGRVIGIYILFRLSQKICMHIYDE